MAAAAMIAVTLGTGPAASDPGETPAGTPRGAFAVLSAGGLHACGILDTTELACWGINSSGQLGLGNDFGRGDHPNEMGAFLQTVDLGADRTAVSVSAGNIHTCAVLDDGTIKCWGNGGDGRLGYGDEEDVGDDGSEMGDDLDPVPLGTGRTALAVVAGDDHTCALLDDGTVKC